MFRRQLPMMAIHIVAIAALIIALVIFARLVVKKQGELLYQEKMQAGRVELSHFVNTAVMPLLDDDALSLNLLMKEAKTIEGVLYVAVTDNDGRVKAHTDIHKIGSIFKKFQNSERQVTDSGAVVERYRLADGTRVLDLSRSINFMQKQVGAVHVGLSETFINSTIEKKLSGLVRNMIVFGIVLVGILVASGLGSFLWLSGTLGRGQVSSADQDLNEERMYINDGMAGATCQSGDDQSGESGTDFHNLSMAEMNRNHVTVLFAGIKGFTAYAEINDHQKLMDDLNDYLSLATHSIHTYGGHIDKFVGDSVIAVFDNAPHEANHAERAVKAAVAMQKALQDSGKNGNPLLLKVGIGINSGVVLSGRIGSSAQNEHVFIGESIKVAYSLNFMAGPGEIVMTRDAYRMVEHLVAVEPMPPQVLMRRTQPWENFRLLKLK